MGLVDPAKTAEFYKEQFGLTELYRRPGDTGEKGVWLSDGYIYFAILKYGEPGAPKLGPGQTSPFSAVLVPSATGVSAHRSRRECRTWGDSRVSDRRARVRPL